MAGVHASGHSVDFNPERPFLLWLYYSPPFGNNLDELIWFLLQINIFWGIINLLPVYPLDGGQIARELFVQSNPQAGIANSLRLSLTAAAGVAVAGCAHGGRGWSPELRRGSRVHGVGRGRHRRAGPPVERASWTRVKSGFRESPTPRP